jgi:hypothetical protein
MTTHLIRIRNRVCLACVVAAMTVSSYATTFTVPGISDPWLAGMPSGTLDNVGTWEPPDVAPAQSPVFAGFVTPGTTLFWLASGEVGHPMDIAGPDGALGVIVNHIVGANNGIPDITAPIDSLIGVFRGPGFGDIFIMGSSGSVVVPSGATEFFMGTMDSYGWANNIGEFDVRLSGTNVPDGGISLGMLSLALGMLGFARRARK